MPSFIHINFLWHFPDKLSMHFFFFPVLFKFFCFSFFLFSTGYSVFSIDCLSCNNSPDEVFFRIRSINKPKLFSSFLTQDSTCIRLFPPLFLFMYNLSTLLFVCNALCPLFFLISCPNLSIHFLSSVAFLLRIWIHSLSMYLLMLFCFSYLGLILGPIEAFT